MTRQTPVGPFINHIATSILIAATFIAMPATSFLMAKTPEGRIQIPNVRYVGGNAPSAPTVPAVANANTAPVRIQRVGSALRQVAQGEVIAEMPIAPLDGSILPGGIPTQHAMHPSHVDAGYVGSSYVDGGYVEPVCGIESGCCDCASCSGSMAACGEVGCGFEEEIVMAPGYPMPGTAIGCDGCGSRGGCDGMGGCGVNACGGCGGLPLFLPRLAFDWCAMEFSAGVQGFTGPTNFVGDVATPNARRGAGSFGFYQSLNHSRELNGLLGIDLAAQLGVRFTQNNNNSAGF
ncbi:MAG: hypothetical protein AAFN70_16005, partial [Planctomycetota bacterium]